MEMKSPQCKGHWWAFIHEKCPHCHHGDMYPDANPYHFKTMNRMFTECTVCRQTYYPETGFYFGAMYMSYALTVLFSVIDIVILVLLFGWNLWLLIGGNTALLIILFPVFFRFARVAWLHLNVSFDKELCERLQYNLKPE